MCCCGPNQGLLGPEAGNAEVDGEINEIKLLKLLILFATGKEKQLTFCDIAMSIPYWENKGLNWELLIVEKVWIMSLNYLFWVTQVPTLGLVRSKSKYEMCFDSNGLILFHWSFCALFTVT